MPQPGTSAPSSEPAQHLRALENDVRRVVARVSTDAADRVSYARDLWPRQQLVTRSGKPAPDPPALVVWPESEEEIIALLRFAGARGVPVVPFGAGSGVCGGIKPTRQSIVLDLKRMRRVLDIDDAQLQVTAQAGILGQHLEDQLLHRGYTLGHYPSSIYCSTLGGWLAARSAGQCSGRYGKIEDMCTALSAIDGAGRRLRGQRGGEHADILPLMIGSEGIFGVITQATLQISRAPSERTFASFLCPTTASGLDIIRQIYQAGLRPAVARLYDPFDSMIARHGSVKGPTGKSRPEHKSRPEQSGGVDGPGLGTRTLARLLRAPNVMNTLIHNLPTQVTGGAKLVLVWEDDPRIARAERNAARDIALAHGADDTGEGPAQHWLKHRHSVSYRQSPIYAAGGFVDTMEVASPWSKLLTMHEAVRKAVAPYAFVMAHFSHAYPDGASIYFTFAGGGENDEECLRKYDALWEAALHAVVQSGGIVSHHHGVGRSKSPQLRPEQGIGVDLLHALKRELDPDHILNPGALLPPAQNHAAPKREVHQVLGDPILGFDEQSRTVKVDGDMPVRHLENELLTRGFTLGGILPDCSVGEWIERGMPGARSLACDPVDQLLSGVDVELGNGQTLSVRPAPRRAVGPDLLGVVTGSNAKLGSVSVAHMVFRKRQTTETSRVLFNSQSQAESAVQELRAAGVRPLHLRQLRHLTGWVVETGFDLRNNVGKAHAELATQLLRSLGGTALAENVSDQLGVAVEPGAHSPLFEALSRCANQPFS